jgi:hypothetical protein
MYNVKDFEVAGTPPPIQHTFLLFLLLYEVGAVELHREETLFEIPLPEKYGYRFFPIRVAFSEFLEVKVCHRDRLVDTPGFEPGVV